MKAIKTTIDGREYYLFYNAEAMFQIQELMPEDGSMGALFEHSRAALDLTVKSAAIMAEQGELARRAYGYDAGEFISAERIASVLAVRELAELKKDVADAVLLGLERRVLNEDKVVDLGLLALEKKTTLG